MRQRLSETEQAFASVQSELRATAETALNNASAATAALRSDLSSLRAAADNTRQELEAEMVSLRQQLQAAIESAERTKRETQEAADAAAAGATEAAVASQHASAASAGALAALESALSAAEERARVAEAAAAAAAQTGKSATAESIAAAERSVKAAEEQAAAATEQATGEQARAQALEWTLETTRAALADASARYQAEEGKVEEKQRRAAAAAAAAAAEGVQLRLLDRELDDLVGCLRDAVGCVRSGGRSGDVGGNDALTPEGGDAGGAAAAATATAAPAGVAERRGDVERLVGMANEASTHANVLRGALAGTMEEVSFVIVGHDCTYRWNLRVGYLRVSGIWPRQRHRVSVRLLPEDPCGTG